MSNLINDSNIDEIIEGAEGEIRTMMDEFGWSPLDMRIFEAQATLLEIIKYLKGRLDE